MIGKSRYQIWLIPYLEGALDERRRAQLEARLESDPALAAEAEALRRVTSNLRNAAAREGLVTEQSPLPMDLWVRVQTRVTARQRRPLGVLSLRWAGAVCAMSLLAAVVIKDPFRHMTAPARNVPPTQIAAMPKAASPLPPALQEMDRSNDRLAYEKNNATQARVTRDKEAEAPEDEQISQTSQTPHLKSVMKTPTKPFMTAKALDNDRPVPAPMTGEPMLQSQKFAMHRPVSEALHDGEANAIFASPPAEPAAMPVGRIPLADSSAGSVNAAASGNAAQRAKTIHRDSIINGAISSAKPSNTPPLSGTSAGGFGGGSLDEIDGEINTHGFTPVGGGVAGNHTGAKKAASAPPVAALAAPTAPPLPPASAGAGVNLDAGNNQTSATARQDKPQVGVLFRSDDRHGVMPDRQEALEQACRLPLYGTDAGAAQAAQALRGARIDGMLPSLRQVLAQQCRLHPDDLVAGRALAALYDFAGQGTAAQMEWRRVAGLPAAAGEDWFQWAQAQERIGQTEQARSAYRHALKITDDPLNESHRSIAVHKLTASTP